MLKWHTRAPFIAEYHMRKLLGEDGFTGRILTSAERTASQQLQGVRRLYDRMEKKGQDRVVIRFALREQLRQLITSIRMNNPSRVALFFPMGQRRLLNLDTGEKVLDAGHPKEA